MTNPELAPSSEAPMAMSIDVEDWFQVENLKAAIPRDSWETQERRVEKNTLRMLELMNKHGARSTCFVLGWVAERHPQLVRDIVAAGHELASHGYGHELLYNIGPKKFREDLRRSKHLLEDISGVQVHGYRAPNFSITDWAIEILAEEGFTYDSSSFPTVTHDRYGRLSAMPAGARVGQLQKNFDEVCVSCLEVAGKNIPWGGGGYLRIYPLWLFSRGVQRIHSAGHPYVFYTHPWEIDPGQPRIRGIKRSYAFRHYVNLAKCESRWESLLKSFRWTTLQEVIRWSRDNGSLPSKS